MRKWNFDFLKKQTELQPKLASSESAMLKTSRITSDLGVTAAAAGVSAAAVGSVVMIAAGTAATGLEPEAAIPAAYMGMATTTAGLGVAIAGSIALATGEMTQDEAYARECEKAENTTPENNLLPDSERKKLKEEKLSRYLSDSKPAYNGMDSNEKGKAPLKANALPEL